METEFRAVTTCVQRTIEAHRPLIDPAALLDVAIGLRNLSDAERREAVVALCRSLIESELRGPVERLVMENTQRLLDEATVEIAAFAISLCGPVESRALFPARY